jgi:hypothetical protein
MRNTFDKLSDLVLAAMPPWLRSQRAVLLAILAVGFIVRVVAKGDVPNGFNNDEAGLAYDAYSILKFGVDRHGIPYPAFLIGWGSGMNALSAYLAIPFIALFGLTEGAVRAVNLGSGLVSLVIFHALVKRIADGKTALWGVFLLALCPWHVMLSRWALESNLLPGVFLLAVWLAAKGTERPRYFLAAGVCFALSLYAYGTAYFAVPVFLFMASVYVLWTRQIAWKVWGASVALFGLVATPIGAVIWANQGHRESFRLAGIGIPVMPTVARYKNVSSLFGSHALKRVWDNLDVLWKIIVNQNDGLIWNAIPGHGILYLFGMALAMIGLLVELAGLFQRGRSRMRVLMLLWLVTGVALAAVQEVNINRVNLIWLPLVYLAAVGMRTVATKRLVGMGLVVVHLLLFTSFAVEYFGPYTQHTAGAFYPSYGKAIQTARAAVPGKICVTDNPVFSYAFVLFYDQTDAREFARTVHYETDGSEFQHVRSFGRYTFGIDHCAPDTEAWILDNGDVDRFRDRAERVERFSNYAAVVAKRP